MRRTLRERSDRQRPRVEAIEVLARNLDRQALRLESLIDRGESLLRAAAELEAKLERRWAEPSGREGGAPGRLQASVDALSVEQREMVETVRWQGESLVSLRRDLAAESEARSRLEPKIERSVRRAYMLWTSKPWRAYAAIARLLRRAVRSSTHMAARLGSVTTAGLDRLSSQVRAASQRVACRLRRIRRVLIIDHRLPTPDQDSGSLRMWNLIEVMQNLRLDVTFLPFNLSSSGPYATRLAGRGVEVVGRPEISSIAEHLKARGQDYDLIVVCRMPLASECLEDVRALCPRAWVVFDTVDLQFLREQRQAQVEGDRSRAARAKRLKERELAVARSANATWVVSSYEKELLVRESPGLKVDLVSNIHRIYGPKAGFEERRDLLFIGGFEHPPNVGAARWLVEEILPIVRAEVPDVHLYLVGSKVPESVLELASKGVTVTGYQPDVGPYFERCRLSMAPLRFGAGVKGKVNQSMAYGVPCVVTSVAAEGIHLTHGRDAMIADTAETFADCVLQAYRDAALWMRLSEGGLENVREHFSHAVARNAVRGSLRAMRWAGRRHPARAAV